MQTILHQAKGICPECGRLIDAVLADCDGTVRMIRTCPDHGVSNDVYWGSAEHYRRLMQFRTEVPGPDQADVAHDCSSYCTFCNGHTVETVIAIIDVTNDCDLCCPVCLSASGGCSYTYRPSCEQVRLMLRSLRRLAKSSIGPTVAFSGGEPTLRDDLPELVKMAHDEGFSRTEVITDGIRVAEDPRYLTALRRAGLSQLGLQFDGLDDDVYKKLRGRPLLGTKLRAIDHARAAGQRIILAVCLARGVNDDQVGDIIRFAGRNKDVVEHVNFQTIAFTGRTSRASVEERRITPSEFTNLVEGQTGGAIKSTEFYPPSFMAPLPEFVEAFTGRPQIKFFVHPCCDLATLTVVNRDGSLTPLNELLKVSQVLDTLRSATQNLQAREGLSRLAYKAGIPFTLLRIAATLIHSPLFRRLLFKSFGRRGHDPLAGLDEILLITCTNYMDPWNFDIEKAQSCAMHYLLPDGRRIPFCCYNIFHRERIERLWGTPSRTTRG